MSRSELPDEAAGQTADAGIVHDYFDAWLDSQSEGNAEPSVDSAAGPERSDDKLSAIIARTASCANLLTAVWPAEKPPLPPSFDAARLPSAGPVRLGRYALLEELGRGRFGIVYRAHDTRLSRDVAIKVARPEVSSRADLARRFAREAASAARLDHPGIVPVHDAGEADQHLFYVMPWCQGDDLARWLARRNSPVDQRVAADLIRQVAEATHYGHTQGIVHRDLKPANILLTGQPGASADAPGSLQARILDFGLSRSLEDELQDTRSSMIVGTPLYMSPEQARHGRGEVGPATDIFALGSILFELLTGQPPFAATNLPEVIDRLRRCEVASPRSGRPEIDPRLEQICLKCLRFDPDDRYATAQDLADDLSSFLQGRPVRARRASVFDRLRWWAARPQRVVEAGTALCIVNVPLAGSMLVLCLLPNLDPARSMASMRVAEMLQSQWPLMLVGLMVAFLGVQAVRGSVLALRLAAFVSAVQTTICGAVMFLGAPPLDMYDGNPFAKWVMHLLLMCLFSVNLGMCLVALYSRHRSAARGAGA